jgi:hypothetical protein
MSNYDIEEEEVKYLCNCGAIIKKSKMMKHLISKGHLDFVII